MGGYTVYFVGKAWVQHPRVYNTHVRAIHLHEHVASNDILLATCLIPSDRDLDDVRWGLGMYSGV